MKFAPRVAKHLISINVFYYIRRYMYHNVFPVFISLF